jgi:hypothetical protein
MGSSGMSSSPFWGSGSGPSPLPRPPQGRPVPPVALPVVVSLPRAVKRGYG